MNLRVCAHVSSQREKAVTHKYIADLNERLMFLQVWLSIDHDMPPIQTVETPINLFDPLYDQLDLSWVDYEVQSMPSHTYNQIPRFDGFNICEGDAHVKRFHSFMKEHLVREEDMCMRFFVMSLD